MAKDGRIAWVERAQTLSMLLVALHHCVPRGYDGPQALSDLLNAIQYPALACFLLTSALFSGRWRRAGWGTYMKRRFVRLMTPYFCVNLLMLAPRYLAALLMGVKAHLTPGWLALSLLDPHGRGVMPHLWFLPALLLMSALLPVIDAAVRRPLPRLAAVAALAVLSALPFRLPTLLCLNELKQYLFCYVAGRALAQARGTETPLRGPAGWTLGGLGFAAFIASLALGARKSFHASLSLGVVLFFGLRTLFFLLSVSEVLPFRPVELPLLTDSLPNLFAECFLAGLLSGVSARNETDLEEDARLSMLAH